MYTMLTSQTVITVAYTCTVGSTLCYADDTLNQQQSLRDKGKLHAFDSVDMS